MNWNEGVCLTGRVGAGKSTILRILMDILLRAGCGCFWFCMKPDEADIAEQAILNAGRGSSLIRFDPGDLLTFNPFTFEMGREGGSANSLANIYADINEVIVRPGREGETFWKVHETTCMTHGINVTHIAHREHANTEVLYQFLSSVPETVAQTRTPEFKEGKCWLTLILAEERVTTPQEKRQVILASEYFLKQLPSAGEKARGAILSGVLNSIIPFIMPPLSQMVNGVSTFNPVDAVQNGSCIIGDYDLATYGRQGLAHQLLLSFILTEVALRRRDTSRPFVSVRDEYQLCAHPKRDVSAQTISRSQNYCSLAAFQTLSVLVDGLGGGIEAKTQAQALYALHVNKFMCNNNCPETNETNSKIIGMKKRWFFSTSPNHQENPLDVLGVGGINISTSQQYHYIYPPVNFMSLRTGGKENKLTVDAVYHDGRGHSVETFKQR